MGQNSIAFTIDNLNRKFDRAFHFVIVSEGGTNDDPIDRGGLTNWGISQKQYPKVDIESLTIVQAKEIYKHDYWYKNKCNLMSPDLAMILFDSSVNCGTHSGAKWLQMACNKNGSSIKVDGIIGTKTMSEVNKYSPYKLHNIILSERLRRYVWMLNRYPLQKKYIKGWVDRVANLIEFSTVSDASMF